MSRFEEFVTYPAQPCIGVRLVPGQSPTVELSVDRSSHCLALHRRQMQLVEASRVGLTASLVVADLAHWLTKVSHMAYSGQQLSW